MKCAPNLLHCGSLFEINNGVSKCCIEISNANITNTT